MAATFCPCLGDTATQRSPRHPSQSSPTITKGVSLRRGRGPESLVIGKDRDTDLCCKA